MDDSVHPKQCRQRVGRWQTSTTLRAQGGRCWIRFGRATASWIAATAKPSLYRSSYFPLHEGSRRGFEILAEHRMGLHHRPDRTFATAATTPPRCSEEYGAGLKNRQSCLLLNGRSHETFEQNTAKPQVTSFGLGDPRPRHCSCHRPGPRS